MRKQLVLVALWMVAGCARQLDCDAAIDQGIQRLTAGYRAYAPDPQTLETGTRTFARFQDTLVRRCKVDRWPQEITQCFATVDSRTDLQACQSRLSPERSSQLTAELARATSGREDRVAECAPPAPRGRLVRSHGGKGEAMKMMIAYKDALCSCNDHDLNCGKAATDAYQRAMADWAATWAGEPVELTARPDPELEQLTIEVADCSRRVFTPPRSSPGGATPPSPP